MLLILYELLLSCGYLSILLRLLLRLPLLLLRKGCRSLSGTLDLRVLDGLLLLLLLLLLLDVVLTASLEKQLGYL